jgi:hypothetical protein
MATIDAVAILAEIHSVRDLQAVLRQRAEELDVSRETLDSISGLQNGYSAKLLTEPPIRGLGEVSYSALAGALAVRIVVVEDCEALERLRPRLIKRVPRGKRRDVTQKYHCATTPSAA